MATERSCYLSLVIVVGSVGGSHLKLDANQREPQKLCESCAKAVWEADANRMNEFIHDNMSLRRRSEDIDGSCRGFLRL